MSLIGGEVVDSCHQPQPLLVPITPKSFSTSGKGWKKIVAYRSGTKVSVGNLLTPYRILFLWGTTESTTVNALKQAPPERIGKKSLLKQTFSGVPFSHNSHRLYIFFGGVRKDEERG